MPELDTGFSRSTLRELVDQAHSDFDAESLPNTRLALSWLNPLVSLTASAAHLAHGLIAYGIRQLFADTASLAYLLRHGRMRGIEQTTATFAAGDWTFTGTIGANIPGGSAFARADGVAYTTDALAVVGGVGTVDVACTADVAGADGNATLGTTASLSAPIAGIDSTVTCTADITSGADEQTEADLREQILEHMADPPQGGAEADYAAWTRAAIANVDKVWVTNGAHGPGTVGVVFSVDDGFGAGGGVIPTAGQVTDVQDYIDEDDGTHDIRRPVTQIVTVAAPVANPINFSFNPFTLSVAEQAAAEAELGATLGRLAELGGTVTLEQLHAAVYRACDEDDTFTMVAPAAAVTAAANEINTMGTVGWP